MNCEDCKELISQFLDNDLDESRASEVREHLAFCLECAKVCEDFASILDVCRTEDPASIIPPNSQALWCRINNIIESEIKQEPPRIQETPQPEKQWGFSFPQLASALLGVALISSLLTIVAIRNYSRPAADDFTTRSSDSQTTFEKLMGKLGLVETPQKARERRMHEMQAAIEYWDNRVRTRREQWDIRVKEAFDRNLSIINDSVNDYQTILEQNPEDEVTGEMLDSAMDDKMSLLREFAEL
jgi:hypothetical protein